MVVGAGLMGLGLLRLGKTVVLVVAKEAKEVLELVELETHLQHRHLKETTVVHLPHQTTTDQMVAVVVAERQQ